MTAEDPRAALTLPDVGERILAAWRAGALVPASAAPVDSDADVRVSGTGESFVVWHVAPADGAQALAVRIPWRTPAQLAQPLGADLPVLAHLPSDLGPHLLAAHLDAGSSPIGLPAIVTTFVPGEILAPEAWTREHLLAHARSLAALHRQPWPGRGRIGDATDPTAGLQRGPMSMLAEIDGAWAWWRRAEPEICARPDTAWAMDAARAVCAAAEPAFAEVTSFVLAHGDLCATNIVWAGSAFEGTIRARYIDVEWAQADDRARDLAIIGGPVHVDPWYVPLDDADLEAFLQAYLAGARALDPRLDLDADALRIRRDAWVAYERTGMLLHVSRRAAQGDGQHQAVLPVLRERLLSWLRTR